MSSTANSISTSKDALFEYILRLADDRLILGHRLSEWCGHGPILEEDIALANIALDYIGHAATLYEYAAEVEGKGRHRDDIVYFRDDPQYKNLKMVELPKGDFGFTIARQFLFSTFSYLLYEKLSDIDDSQLGGMFAKHLKEIKYHLRHSREWVYRLGDGTEESHQRIQDAFNELWTYTDELFYTDEVDKHLRNKNLAVDLEEIRPKWKETVIEILEKATLEVPDFDQYMVSGGRTGFHTEHLGHLLAEMQHLRRSYPEANWE
ncbi:phenylacetate-CoA oxygenase subunit PaaC [Aliifodinibius sp. S!AR15-10]|uniref:1,2-phenylacetyl-CoA epoxidase subunit PaaC n=1 Tax=Aliifodinibius sp. S!AR15-10 TaxID=2950437 RepID=UPI00285B4339|nr:1,2-phenylacetyl-CoA epoxidase subunit PaaC [Aliifodinibius sp. S!AR15-10]MDR8393302.1 phenylacetate-CoA oxygenase subunit PaaC [Aliifodinibius sp. S!AR15-10]